MGFRSSPFLPNIRQRLKISTIAKMDEYKSFIVMLHVFPLILCLKFGEARRSFILDRSRRNWILNFRKTYRPPYWASHLKAGCGHGTMMGISFHANGKTLTRYCLRQPRLRSAAKT